MPGIDAAIGLLRQAVDLTLGTSPGYAQTVASLGLQLSLRYSTTNAISNLDKSIQCIRRGIAVTPEYSSSLAKRLNNLGNQLRE